MLLGGCGYSQRDAELIEPTNRPAAMQIAQGRPATGHPIFLDPITPSPTMSDLAAVEADSPR